MAIERTIACDKCGHKEVEKESNEGWSGWGALQGIVLNGAANPTLCPSCLTKVADYLDKLGVNHGVD